MAEGMVLTAERKAKVQAHLKRAVTALLDAQMEMLADTPLVYEWDLSKRLSPELFSTYKAAELAEISTVTAQRLLDGE